MPLQPGTRLGPYEVIAAIGAGGMGEVYQARDTALNRDVAIKVLPDSLAGNSDRLARFQREAKALAALNHPNIAHIHGLETSGDTPAIVMELVEGPTLADRIKAGPIALDEALPIARQIADALEAAHERGIIHRDLKPANVKVKEDGTVKVLDFGLAKAVEPRTDAGISDAANSPTMTSPAMTAMGMVLGTAAYMAPEQARGKAVDKRVDIWAFGCVLWECLTGRRLFDGTTAADSIGAILRTEPDWERLPANTSLTVRRLLRRCLAKDPRKRLHDIADARIELEETDQFLPATQRSSRGYQIAVAVLAIALAASMAWLLPLLPAADRADSAGNNPLADASFSKLTDFEGSEFDAAISPDGRFVAFVSDRDGPFEVLVHQVGAGDFRKLTSGADALVLDDARAPVRNVGFNSDGSEIWLGGASTWNRVRTLPLLGGPARNFLGENVIAAAWSPDGEHVAYYENVAGDPLYVADRNGANRRLILGPPAGTHQHYPIWSVDGEWIYVVRGWLATLEMDLWRVRPDGEELEQLTQRKLAVSYPTPIDERTVLYSARDADGAGPWLWAMDVESKVSRRASVGLEQYASVAASADGRRLVATVQDPGSQLWNVPILDRLATEDDVTPFADLSTTRALAPRFGGSSLFYLSSRGSGDGLWRYSEGKVTEIWRGSETALLEPPAVSPDGETVVVLLRTNDGWRLHTLGADGTALDVLTESIDARGAAAWSPDGQWIVTGGYEGGVQGLFLIPADRGRAPVRIVEGEALNPVWSADGNLIVYTGPQVNDSSPLLAVRPDGETVELPDIQVLRFGQRARFLPDGTGLVTMQGQGPNQDFWLLDLVTMQSRRLTGLDPALRVRTFDLAPDGTQIVFDRLSEDSDIVLIELDPGR